MVIFNSYVKLPEGRQFSYFLHLFTRNIWVPQSMVRVEGAAKVHPFRSLSRGSLDMIWLLSDGGRPRRAGGRRELIVPPRDLLRQSFSPSIWEDLGSAGLCCGEFCILNYFEHLWTLLHLTLNHCVGNSLILTQQQQVYLIRSGMNRPGVEEIMTYTIELITVSLLWQDSCAMLCHSGWLFPQLTLQRWLWFRYVHVKVVVLCQMANNGHMWSWLGWSILIPNPCPKSGLISVSRPWQTFVHIFGGTILISCDSPLPRAPL